MFGTGDGAASMVRKTEGKRYTEIAGKQKPTFGDRPIAICSASDKTTSMFHKNRTVRPTRQGVSGARTLCWRCCC